MNAGTKNHSQPADMSVICNCKVLVISHHSYATCGKKYTVQHFDTLINKIQTWSIKNIKVILCTSSFFT